MESSKVAIVIIANLCIGNVWAFIFYKYFYDYIKYNLQYFVYGDIILYGMLVFFWPITLFFLLKYWFKVYNHYYQEWKLKRRILNLMKNMKKDYPHKDEFDKIIKIIKNEK